MSNSYNNILFFNMTTGHFGTRYNSTAILKNLIKHDKMNDRNIEYYYFRSDSQRVSILASLIRDFKNRNNIE